MSKKFQTHASNPNKQSFSSLSLDKDSSDNQSTNSEKNNRLLNQIEEQRQKDRKNPKKVREQLLLESKNFDKLDESILTEKIQSIKNYPKFLEKYNITFQDLNPFFDVNN